MKLRLKKLADQVVVITGATSGIGLSTARMAARRGARLVVSARNGEALEELAEEIHQGGGEVECVVADVGHEEEVHGIAQAAVERFGGFDTWVNNAGISIFGRLLEVSTEDHRRLFETNFWGVVYGSLEAARRLSTRNGYAGAIINVGSTLSDRAIPIQGMYSTSKHAVKGFTDALRMELEKDRLPISLTLIKPSSINTPFTWHAKNYMDEEPSLPPPVYAPEVAAQAILHCAETPQRDVFVGSGGKFISALGYYAPRLADLVMEATFFRQQKAGRPKEHHDDALHGPTLPLQERGDYEGHVAESSVYTRASLNPLVTGALVLGAGLSLAALLGQASTARHRR